MRIWSLRENRLGSHIYCVIVIDAMKALEVSEGQDLKKCTYKGQGKNGKKRGREGEHRKVVLRHQCRGGAGE